MKKDLTLNIRVDAKLREAIEAWCKSQVADTSYGAFFRAAAKKMLKDSGHLPDDYSETSIRHGRRTSKSTD